MYYVAASRYGCRLKHALTDRGTGPVVAAYRTYEQVQVLGSRRLREPANQPGKVVLAVTPSDRMSGNNLSRALMTWRRVISRQSPLGTRESGIRLTSEREYLHLVRNRTGLHWCRTTIQDDEPSPFTEEVMTADVPPLADAIMWRIVEDLSQIRAALKAHGTGEEQTFHLIGENYRARGRG